MLILEDQAHDADLVRHEVLRTWPGAVFSRADGRDGFMAGLLEFHPDVVLSDHALPSYTGSDALAQAPDTPRQLQALVEGAPPSASARQA